jgi:hypothetical protein
VRSSRSGPRVLRGNERLRHLAVVDPVGDARVEARFAAAAVDHAEAGAVGAEVSQQPVLSVEVGEANRLLASEPVAARHDGVEGIVEEMNQGEIVPEHVANLRIVERKPEVDFAAPHRRRTDQSPARVVASRARRRTLCRQYASGAQAAPALVRRRTLPTPRSRRLAMKRQLTLNLVVLALAAGIAASAGSAASFNDGAPCPASGPLLVCPTMQVGQSVHLQLLGRDGCDVYRWEMVNGGLPLGLSMSSSGLVTGTPTRAEETKPWMIIHDLTAPEGGPSWCGGDNHSERQFVFTVSGGSGGTPPPPPPPAPPLQVTSSTLATATTGSGYSAQLTASGGNSYSWALSSGSLPAGLGLAASGRLSGTPTSAGAYSFGVRVTDEKGRTATGSIALRVLEQLAAIAPADQQWEVGRPLEIPIQGKGGVPAYHWSISGALPKNTAFIDYEGDGTNVRLHGVPGEEGTFPLTITMSDSGGHSARVQLTLTVLPKLRLRTFDPGRATVGKRYQLKLSSGGGVGQLSWTVAKGSLAAGLALDPASGVISGKPRLRGTYRFTVTVTDSLGAKASMSFSLLVRRAPPKR